MHIQSRAKPSRSDADLVPFLAILADRSRPGGEINLEGVTGSALEHGGFFCFEPGVLAQLSSSMRLGNGRSPICTPSGSSPEARCAKHHTRSRTRSSCTAVLGTGPIGTRPAVGRKTGNVVRSVWYGEPGLPVDTHVMRLSARLKLTNETDAVKIEKDLGGIVPPAAWGLLSLRLIEHGRQVCNARKPKCDVCALNDICPSAFKV